MSELVNSRCKDCSPQSFQCTPCSKLDVTVRRQMRQKKEQKKHDQSPVCLFPLPHVFPSMPEAVPLSIHGQVMHPLSIASPNMGNVISPVSPPVKVQKTATKAKAIPKVLFTPKASTKPAVVVTPVITYASPAAVLLSTTATTKRLRDEFDINSEEEESDAVSVSSSASSLTETGEAPKKDANSKPAKMARITKEERVSVCDWIIKDRQDGKMLNGRWIRNGGAKGATMTATSSEVKTSGAYEALALYVNRRCRGVAKSIVWNKDIAKKRWAAMLVMLLFLFCLMQ
jgi:hypothetical protein